MASLAKHVEEQARKSDQVMSEIVTALTAPGGQFEVMKTTVRGLETVVYARAPATLRDYFLACHLHPNQTFLVYNEERYSFAETYAKAMHYGAALQSAYGIAKGDRVVLAMRNYPDWIFCFMGLISIGAVVVPLNAWWKPEEMDYALRHSGARLVIADEERARRVVQIEGPKPLVTIVRSSHPVAQSLGADVFEDKLSKAAATPDYLPPLDPEDDCTILYTSGSTGDPKGAVSTHRGAVHGIMGLLQYGLTLLAMDERMGTPGATQQVTLLSVPLFHVTGSHAIFLTSIAAGRALVFMHKWDAGEALRLMEKEKVTYFVGVPTMSLELMLHPDRDKYDLSTLRDLGAGGAARPAEHVTRLADAFKGKRPGIGYGLTETNALCVVNNRDSYLCKPASTGRAIRPIMELKIALDDQGTSAPVGEVGEIWWKTAALVRGYWHNPEATAAAFTADGWFKSGDLGYLDEEGFLYVVDRKKDIIIRGGENISCLEVESALYAHPAVAEASVFGLSDERLGEIVGAVIFPKPGEALTEGALLDFAATKLAAFKVPSQVWMVDQPLPRLGSGKIDKVSLKTHYRALRSLENSA